MNESFWKASEKGLDNLLRQVDEDLCDVLKVRYEINDISILSDLKNIVKKKTKDAIDARNSCKKPSTSS